MSTSTESLKRRDFLKTSGLAAISAAAVATGAASTSASAASQNLAQTADSKSIPATSAPDPIGPRATFHALDYYRQGRSDADVIQEINPSRPDPRQNPVS
jgi:secreted PhoX family phosphatase